MSGTLDIRECFCLRTRRSARLLTQFYDGIMRPSGLRATQFTLLGAIAEMSPVTQQPLAKFMGMDRTTLTRNLALLERDGLAMLGRSATDGRQREIRLTPKGEGAVKRARPFWEQAQREARAVFDEGGPGSGAERWFQGVEAIGRESEQK